MLIILAFQLLGELSELFHFEQYLLQSKDSVSVNYLDGPWSQPSQSQFRWQGCNVGGGCVWIRGFQVKTGIDFFEYLIKS